MKLSYLTTVATLLAAPLLAAPAHADLPPPDGCDTPGSSCNNAGPDYNEPGTCTKQKCQRSRPSEDGGITTIEYDCNVCARSDRSATSSTSGGATPDGSTGTGAASSDDGGCAMGGAASGGAMAGLMLLCGAAALVAARRRR